MQLLDFNILLQVNRPLAMKKDGIQTRNRKVGSKSKKKKQQAQDGVYENHKMTPEEQTMYPFSPIMVPGQMPPLGHLMPGTPPHHLITPPRMPHSPPPITYRPHLFSGVTSALS